jgi:carboxyl-terminal processing protease
MILEYEIIKRYYFERGKVEITFDDDPDWAKVKEILLDNAEYESLLVK